MPRPPGPLAPPPDVDLVLIEDYKHSKRGKAQNLKVFLQFETTVELSTRGRALGGLRRALKTLAEKPDNHENRNRIRDRVLSQGGTSLDRGTLARSLILSALDVEDQPPPARRRKRAK